MNLLDLLVTAFILILLGGAIWWWLGVLALRPPFGRAAQIVLATIFIIILIGMVLGQIPLISFSGRR